MYLLKHEKFRRVCLAVCFALAICLVVGLTPASAVLSGNIAPDAVAFAADDEPTPWEGDYDFGFYTPTATKYYIGTPEELAGFSAIVAGLGKYRNGTPIPADDFKGATVYLTADLDMGGVYDEMAEAWGGPTWVDLGATAETQSWPLGGTGNANRLTSITATTAGTAIRYTNGCWTGPQWWPVGTYPQTIPVVAGEAMISAGASIASDPTIVAMPTTAAIARVENLLFQGTFNGQYHSISNIVSLYPDDADLRDPGDNIELHNTGLFGNVGASGTVKNVIIDSGEFNADSYTSTIAGRCAGKIENCASYADACGSYNNAAGGIVGVISGNGASVKNCFFGGTVLFEVNSNSGVVGGIVGQNSGGTIGFTVENCYSYGWLGTNSTNVARLPGLLIGRAQGTNMAKIVNSYAVDDPVIYDASSASPVATAGALVGFNTLTNALIDADSAAKDAASMKTREFAAKLGGAFAFDYWGDNDGYPIFMAPYRAENEVEIALDPTDGTLKKTDVTEFKKVMGIDKWDLPDPTPPAGYKFDGWYVEDEDDMLAVNGTYVGDEGLDDDATLYAKYSAQKYNITIDPGDGKVTVIQVSYEDTYTALGGVAKPTRPGYEFGGWFTAKDGEGDFVDKDSLAEMAQTHTLYAYWIAKDLTVYFNKNGKNAKLETRSKYITEATDDVYGALPVPARTGYKFDGWYDKKKGGNEIDEETTVSAVTVDKEEQTLYAHWEAKAYTVKFNVNGGNKLPKASKKVTFDKKFGKLPTAKRAGYKFLGWYTGAKYGTKVTAKSTATQKTINIARSTAFYAHWKKK